MRRFIYGLLFIVPLILGLLSPVAAQDDCGSGVSQGLTVGGAGQVVPGQSANRLRSSPGGQQSGSIQPGEIFTVIGGPECANEVSWWQVQLPDGTSGWTGEGVGGQRFIETAIMPSGGGGAAFQSGGEPSDLIEALLLHEAEVDLRETVANEEKPCGVPSFLKTGQHVQFLINPLDLEVYYGHPLLEGHLYSGKRLLQKAATVKTTFFDGALAQVVGTGLSVNVAGFIAGFYESGGVLTEGPVCFNGSYLWQVYNQQTGLAYWVNEFDPANPDDLILYSDNQQVVPLPAFQPQIYTLEALLSAPVISALEQLAYGQGGGPQGSDLFDDWYLNGSCRFGSPRGSSILDYYANECLTLYPFEPDQVVTIRLIQPDGALFSEGIKEPEQVEATLVYDWSNEGPVEISIPLNGIHVDLPDAPGLPSGMWIVEAQQGARTIRHAYHLNRMAAQGLYALCDGAAVQFWVNNFPPYQAFDAVLYEYQTADLDQSGFVSTYQYTEIGRWRIDTGLDGHAILKAAVQPAKFSMLAIVEPDSNATIFTDSLFIGTTADMAYPPDCIDDMADVDPPQLEYNRLYRNAFGERSTIFDNGATYPGVLVQPDRIHHYVFQGQQGDAITIRMIQQLPALDPASESEYIELTDAYLTLLDPDGNLLIEDDNSAGSPYQTGDAAIQNFVLPVDGIYTLITEDRSQAYTSSSTDGISSYTLMIEAPDINSRIVVNSPVSGELVTENVIWHLYGTANDIITLNAKSTEFDIQVALKDEAGSVLATDDDSGIDFLDARIEAFSLPATGVYTIEISNLNGKTGTYMLEVNR